MIEIPADPFQTGSPGDGDLKTKKLEQFFINRFEITNQEFIDWDENHNFYPGTGAHPSTQVTWQEANDYCIAQNKRLPISNEWGKAARGLDSRVYPWGNKRLKKKFLILPFAIWLAQFGNGRRPAARIKKSFAEDCGISI
jgi:formylglycine-generating enzyme required for sulfatase activity